MAHRAPNPAHCRHHAHTIPPVEPHGFGIIDKINVFYNDAGGDGRGNLRENREDPAPTVGVGGAGHCGVLPLAIIRHK